MVTDIFDCALRAEGQDLAVALERHSTIGVGPALGARRGELFAPAVQRCLDGTHGSLEDRRDLLQAKVERVFEHDRRAFLRREAMQQLRRADQSPVLAGGSQAASIHQKSDGVRAPSGCPAQRWARVNESLDFTPLLIPLPNSKMTTQQIHRSYWRRKKLDCRKGLQLAKRMPSRSASMATFS